MCCSGPKWKREVVPDHKFDFVDTREFTDNGFLMRVKYLWLYIIVLKSFLVYVSDIFSAVTMLTTSGWSNDIFNKCKDIDGCISIPFQTGKWLFVGSIIFGFLLLGYESRKAKKIIASRDISYAFTNVIANHYYSLRSYDHFCFFDHISSSTKTSDDFAFFVFFTFKSWKRLLLADGPRQSINALTLYAVYLVKSKNDGAWYDLTKYFKGNTSSTTLLTITTLFTVTIFAGSLLLLIIAGICYVPLLMHIRGNLKEYCCHKVDKRIDAVIKRRQKQRLADEAKKMQKEAAGDYSHLKNKKGEIVGKPLPQPTLPTVSLDDDELDDTSSYRTRTPAPAASLYTNETPYQHGQDNSSGFYSNNSYHNEKSVDYVPPMPAYNPYSHHQGSDVQFQASQASFGVDYRQQYFDDEQDSQAHFNQAQYSQGDLSRPGTTAPSIHHQHQHQQDYLMNPADVYGGQQAYSPAPAASGYNAAYDDGSTNADPYGAYSYSQQQQQYGVADAGSGRRPSPGPGRL